MKRLISASVPIMNSVVGDSRGRWAGIFLLFLLAAVVQTWPLVLHTTNRAMDVPAQPGDTAYHLWNLWWVKHALLNLQNPFHTDVLFFPQGASLLPGGLHLVNGVLSIPLQLATGNLILSWNILALSFLVCSGMAMYALSFRVTQNHAAALISGFMFAFAPFALIRLQAGEWNIFMTWPIPLFVLFLVRFEETGRLREAVAAGIVWAVLTYNWLEYATDAALFLGLFLAYWSFVYLRKRDLARLSSLWRGFAVVAGVWFAVSSPLLIPSLQAVYSGDFVLNVPGGDEFYSGDLLSFVTPSPLWGPGTVPGTPHGQHLPVGSIESTAYLGIVPLLLAGLAVFAVRRTPHRVLFWAFVFLVFAILSLGPFLYVGGTKTLSVLGVSLSIPLPYHIYDQLPLFGARRIPARLIIFGLVGLSVLAGTGFDLLTGWLRPRSGKIVPLAAVIIFSLVAIEYWNPPVFLSDLTTPAIMAEIRDEPGDFTVVHAPLGRRDGWYSAGDSTGGWIADHYQRVHERATFGGYVGRAKDLGWIMEQPSLAFLSCPRCEDLPSQDGRDPALVRSFFRQYRIRYVVLHKLDPRGQGLFYIGESELTALDSYIREIVGMTSIYSDPILTVYRNLDVRPEDTPET